MQDGARDDLSLAQGRPHHLRDLLDGGAVHAAALLRLSPGSAPGSPENALWIERERKLLKIILWPAMVVVWVLGLALALTHRCLRRRAGSTPSSRWCSRCPPITAGWSAMPQKLAKGERRLTGKALRMLNEVPGDRRRADRRPGDRQAVLNRVERLVDRASRIDAAARRAYIWRAATGIESPPHPRGRVSLSPSPYDLPAIPPRLHPEFHHASQRTEEENRRPSWSRWPRSSGVEGASTLRRQDLMFAILKEVAEDGEEIMGQGTIEVLHGRLRLPAQPRGQLPRRPRRHLRLAQPGPQIGPAHRRHRRRRDPRAQGRRALFRARPSSPASISTIPRRSATASTSTT